MRTRRPFRPRQSPLHKERTMSALNVTIDPSIKGAWPEARLGCFIYTADVRAAKTLSGPASKTRLPRTSKPCWRPRRWPRSPTSTNPGRRTRPSARTPDASAFRPNRCTAGCARARPFTRSTASWTPTTLVSLETGFSLGSYDTARIGADIVFRLGKAGEVYPGIGKDDIALENMPLLADGEGAFGSPTATLPAP